MGPVSCRCVLLDRYLQYLLSSTSTSRWKVNRLHVHTVRYSTVLYRHGCRRRLQMHCSASCFVLDHCTENACFSYTICAYHFRNAPVMSEVLTYPDSLTSSATSSFFRTQWPAGNSSHVGGINVVYQIARPLIKLKRLANSAGEWKMYIGNSLR